MWLFIKILVFSDEEHASVTKSATWCFDRKLEQTRQKNPQDFRKDEWITLGEFTLLFFNFTKSFSMPYIKIVVHLELNQILFSLIGIPLKDRLLWLMQNVFFHPQGVEFKFRYTMCFILQNLKNWELFSESQI